MTFPYHFLVRFLNWQMRGAISGEHIKWPNAVRYVHCRRLIAAHNNWFLNHCVKLWHEQQTKLKSAPSEAIGWARADKTSILLTIFLVFCVWTVQEVEGMVGHCASSSKIFEEQLRLICRCADLKHLKILRFVLFVLWNELLSFLKKFLSRWDKWICSISLWCGSAMSKTRPRNTVVVQGQAGLAF